MKYRYSLVCALIFLLSGCGGGGSSGDVAINVNPAPQGDGELLLLLGDNPLDGVAAVNVQISTVSLLGSGRQVDLPLAQVPTEINLLALQNLTEALFAGQVEEGSFSKIRLEINTLQVIEADNATPIDVQLPANGRIDLNLQGPLDIIPGEAVIIEIDVALDRSLQIVSTGNSRFRFRPVVFVDALTASDLPRLTRVFGEVRTRNEAGEPPFDLCVVGSDDCFDITIPAALRFVDAQDQEIPGFAGLEGATFHLFGSYFIQDVEPQRLRFQPILAIQATADGIDSVIGDIATLNLPDTFTLTGMPETNVVLTEAALLVDQFGIDDDLAIAPGDVAEVWTRTPIEGDLTSALVIVRPGGDEDQVEGTLLEIDGAQLNLEQDQCVLVFEDTVFQLIEESDEVLETSQDFDLGALDALFQSGSAIEIAAFGVLGSECLEASFVSAAVAVTP